MNADIQVKLQAAWADRARILKGWRPGEQDLAGAPLLSRWYIARHPHGGELALCGDVAAHPRLGTQDITTSPLLVICADDEGYGWARTWSRFYRLGDTGDPSFVPGLRMFEQWPEFAQ
jgi:hypothetical protein